jgi:hypothetical protein
MIGKRFKHGDGEGGEERRTGAPGEAILSVEGAEVWLEERKRIEVKKIIATLKGIPRA